MCGRYSLFASAGAIEEHVDASFESEFEPRYNAAPGQDLPVVTDDEPDALRRLEWGFVPPWADERSDFELVNARAETVAEKPAFERAYESGHSTRGDESDTPKAGRCLVPADGFYEWTGTNGESQPYRVTLEDESLFAMAGVWGQWNPPQRQTGLEEWNGGGGSSGGGGGGTGVETSSDDADDAPIETFAIVTTEPNDVVGELHDRMAVVLDRDENETWLHGDEDERRSLLSSYGGEMSVYPVTTAIGDPANDSPAVAEPLDGRGT